MSPSPAGGDDITIYEVRISEAAEVEIETAYLWRLQFGLEAADKWHQELERVLDSLRQFPHRYPLTEEHDPSERDVRRLLCGKSHAASHIYFRIFEPEGNEAGVVRILHVQPAMRQDSRFG